MAKKFYVAANLEHNTQPFKAGDTISLDPKSPEAIALLNAGVIQAAPLDPAPEPEAPQTERVEEPLAQPEVGGAPVATGEPGLDGAQAAAAPRKPGIMRRVLNKIEEEVSAAEDAVEEAVQAETVEEPKEDISANL